MITYRGVSYKSPNPISELTQSEIGGVYRSTECKLRYPRHIPVPSLARELKYCSISYSIGDAIDIRANLLSKHFDAMQIAEVSVSAVNRQQIVDEVNSAHLANISNNLERRLQVAIEKGDKDLIWLLQSEARQLA